MKQPTNLRLAGVGAQDVARLVTNLNDIISRANQQLNQLSEGLVAAVHNAATAAPTTGAHERGDFVLNSAPSELGSASSKYIIHGWRCTVGGTPGTWVQCRFLTGN